MIFAVGTKVSFLHTGETGRITAILGNNMVNVMLDDIDMEIPVNIDDLMTLEAQRKEAEQAAKEAKKPKFPLPSHNPRQKKSSKKLTEPVSAEIMAKKDLDWAEGLFLAFEPQKDVNGQVFGYLLHLINHTPFKLIFMYDLKLNQRREKHGNDILSPFSSIALSKITHIQLNDAPVFWLKGRPATTSGAEPWVEKTLKVKAKQFFKKEGIAPLLGRVAHIYLLMDKFTPRNMGLKLSDYTKSHQPKLTENKSEMQAWYDEFDKVISPQDLASFPREIDLHIAVLSPADAKRNKAEILDIQLQHCEEYVQQAIHAQVTPVVIIHGKGKGRLRSEVLRLLRGFHEVVKIEEHFNTAGATRIHLRR